MTETTCPYCNYEQEEPEECCEEDTLYETECEECEKTYGISPFYIKGYHESKLPCANGEPHNWEPIIGAPIEYFKGRYRCSYCGEEKFEEQK